MTRYTDYNMNDMQTFRASIIYTGSYSGKSGCAFVNAYTKEEAREYIDKIIKKTLKKNGRPEDCFKLEVTASSKEEIQFYVQNRYKTSYTGILN
jgi:hypothetical protein